MQLSDLAVGKGQNKISTAVLTSEQIIKQKEIYKTHCNIETKKFLRIYNTCTIYIIYNYFVFYMRMHTGAL